MKKLKEFWNTLPNPITISRLDGVLIITISALAGIIVGMICSPRKNAKYGCGNGTTTINNWDSGDEDDFWEETDEE